MFNFIFSLFRREKIEGWEERVEDLLVERGANREEVQQEIQRAKEYVENREALEKIYKNH